MALFRDISIKQRLTLIIMAISFISVVMTTLVISVMGVVQMRANLRDDINKSAAILGASYAAALEFDTYDRLSLNVFDKKSDIIFACLVDTRSFVGDKQDVEVGRHPSVTDAPQFMCPDVREEQTVMSNDFMGVMRPIIEPNGEVGGYIYLQSTLAPIHRYIQKQTTVAITVGLAALLVSYLLAINLQRTISQPILSLSDTARAISRDKDYSVRAPQIHSREKEDKNELVILTNSFNEMLTEISARDKQLKKQYVDLEKAKDAAESANRAKSQFLANISHELRTPLNAVIGFSSILMNQLFGPLGDPKYWEYAKDINESGSHLLDIINDILDLSKAEAGKLELNYEEVHIPKSINKCITILSERAEKNQVAIHTDVPKMLPPIVADRLRFIQIVLNVLSNAVKFTKPGGRVDVAVKTRELAGEVTHFVITIADTGIGMSQTDIDKAFQSFGQVDSGLNRKYEGTGLGLPLTKKLVDLHHGTIAFDSTLDKGTTVTLTFPALPPEGSGYQALA